MKLLKIIGYYKFMSREPVSLWVKYLGKKEKKKEKNCKTGKAMAPLAAELSLLNPHS